MNFSIAVVTVPIIDFELPLELVIIGMISGLVYALLGVGLALVYKTSRVLNFAHGEIGALAATVIPVLVVNRGWSYWLVLPLALAIGAAAGAVMEVVVIRRLDRAPRLVVLVATIGAAQVFFVANVLIPKIGAMASQPFPTPFEATITIGDLRLGAGQLMILVLVPLLTVGIAAFLRLTRVGLGARASAENMDAALLAGIPVRRVSLALWIVAGLLACASAILLGPTRAVVTQQALGPQLMVRALAAAMIGGLTNLPKVFVGGVVIGVLETLLLWNYPTGGTLEVALFVIVLVSLLLQRGLGQLARGTIESSWSLSGRVRSIEPRLARIPLVRNGRRAWLAALLVLALLAPLPASSEQRVLLSNIVLFAVIGLSLVVLTGLTGQVSLGQFAIVAVGAIVGGRLHQLGYPAWAGVIYAGLAGAAASLLAGLPALRIRGLFLAVTTLAFAVAANGWLFQQRWLVQTDANGSSLFIPRGELFGIDLQSERNYYWLCLALLLCTSAMVHRLRESGMGRAMMAVRDNEPSAAAFGVSPVRVKLVASLIAGTIAGVAGWFYGGLLVRFGDFSQVFGPEQSLSLVALVIFGGLTTVTGAIAGALWVRGIPYLFGPNWGLFSSGIGLLAVLLFLPGGLAAALFRIRDRVVERLTGEKTAVLATSARVDAVPRSRLPAVAADSDDDGPLPMEAIDIVVRYGGLTAVDHVSLHARRGEIVGLLGPNGAGKTTLFDVLSGHVRPTSGRVVLGGVDVTGLPPQERARLGLGRTFQQARLFDELSLADAMKVALECEEPSEAIPSLLGLPPSRRAEARKDLRADELLELLGLDGFSRRAVSELSTGTRRMAELGCVVALGAKVVLLDEPTAGVAQREVEAFRPVLREIRDHLDATMIIIEHDIPLMMDLVDRLYVVASGSLIAEGPPEVLRDDPKVVAAYVGSDERAIARSGAGAPVTAHQSLETGMPTRTDSEESS